MESGLAWKQGKTNMARNNNRGTGDTAPSASQSGNSNQVGAKRSPTDDTKPREALMAMLPDSASRQRLASEMREMPDDDPLWSIGHAIAIAARDGRNKSITEIEKRVKTAAENAIDRHITVRAIQSWTVLTVIIATAVGVGTIIGTIIGATLVARLMQ